MTSQSCSIMPCWESVRTASRLLHNVPISSTHNWSVSGEKLFSMDWLKQTWPVHNMGTSSHVNYAYTYQHYLSHRIPIATSVPSQNNPIFCINNNYKKKPIPAFKVVVDSGRGCLSLAEHTNYIPVSIEMRGVPSLCLPLHVDVVRLCQRQGFVCVPLLMQITLKWLWHSGTCLAMPPPLWGRQG